MKSLAGLIRLHRWQLDEKRRQLADLERMIADLESQCRRIETELVAEQQVAKDSVEAGFAYGGYGGNVIRQRKTLNESIGNLRDEASGMTTEIAGAFEELKRFELTQTNRDARARTARNQRDQQALDEVGLEIHRRKQSAEGLSSD